MMHIEYKDKKMVITHPSGHVDIYDEAYLKDLKGIEEQRRDSAAQSVAILDDSITQVKVSKELPKNG